jgi:hypothetical protein
MGHSKKIWHFNTIKNIISTCYFYLFLFIQQIEQETKNQNRKSDILNQSDIMTLKVIDRKGVKVTCPWCYQYQNVN